MVNDKLLLYAVESNVKRDDMEELLILGVAKSYNPTPYCQRFSLQNLSEEFCEFNFRFLPDDIYRVADLLRLPDFIICENRTKSDKVEAFCILLRRMVYPNRLGDLCSLFSRSKAELSYICKATLNLIFNSHKHLIQDLKRQWLLKEDLLRYAKAIAEKGAPLKNCWGFIDGTARPICRPKRDQRLFYSGHKRIHALKYQSILSPDGLIVNLFGPIEGRRHDSHMLRISGIIQELENVCGKEFCIYGDPGYPLRNVLVVPFRGAQLSPEEESFNKKMSAVRESVEWGFGKIVQNFAFLDFKKNLKLLLQPVGVYYIVGALLTNVHTCIYGSTSSHYFGIDPPTVEHYLEFDKD